MFFKTSAWIDEAAFERRAALPQPSVAHFSKRYMGQLVRLSYLAPDIIAAIANGTQPVDLTGRKIMRQNNIPLDWPSQRAMFGFAAKG